MEMDGHTQPDGITATRRPSPCRRNNSRTRIWKSPRTKTSAARAPPFLKRAWPPPPPRR
ncbi:hypothetical protein [Senegalimassilia anaerobia]|uniref:hypothetical protein n=1 Tax=Senegalimassilia anaerobia TaxID=1473216 RepID=UPI003CD0D31C